MTPELPTTDADELEGAEAAEARSDGAETGDVDVPAPRRRRSAVTAADRWVLVAMVVAAGLLGILSPGAPTGNDVVDASYRALFVILLSLAASRARRRSVIIASAVAAAGSVGFGLLFGGIALLMAVLLVGRDVRNRAYGACIGAFIAMACLRLDLDLFVGAPTLAAAVTSGLVFWSGYRVSRSRTRTVVRRAIAVAVLLLVVGVGMAVYQAATSASPLLAAVESTTSGISAVQDGRTTAAAAEFGEAADEFGRVADRSSAWWLFPARMVPVLAQNIDAVATMSSAGASLTEAAQRTTADVDYTRIQRDGGGVDLAVLADFLGPVADASRRLEAAADEVDEIRSPWVVAPLADRVDEFRTEVVDLRAQTDLAEAALRYGPAMFGAEGERRYLVLLGNPAESRDLGGHIGNWAELRMIDGSLELIAVGRALELAQPELENAVQEASDLPPSYSGMRPATNPQNWGSSLNFPLDASVAARLFTAKFGRAIDGVLYVDPEAMAAILQITGPIPIPGLGRALDAERAARFLTVDQFVEFPTSAAADESLTELTRTLFQTLTRTKLPGPRELGVLFGPLVEEGRLRMVSLRQPDHALLGRVGLDDGFVPTAGEDLLAVVSRNANPSKIDAYLHRDVSYDVEWDPATGAVRSTVTVILRNDAPASGLPRDAIGNSAGLPAGTNISDLAVISPFEIDRATVDGVDGDVSPLWDDGVWRHNVRVEIPPGGTRTVVMELEGEVAAGSTYRLHFGGQPLTNDGTVTARVVAPGREIVDGETIEVDEDTAKITLRDAGQTYLTLRVR